MPYRYKALNKQAKEKGTEQWDDYSGMFNKITQAREWRESHGNWLVMNMKVTLKLYTTKRKES